jgi:hypothetical protein
MGEVVLYAIVCVNLAVVVALAVDRFRSRGAVDDRLSDLSDAAGSVAQELLARTESLMDLKQYLPEPAQISLINQNPMQGIIDLIKTFRGETIQEDNFTGPPRSESGRWINGPTKDEDTPPPIS